MGSNIFDLSSSLFCYMQEKDAWLLKNAFKNSNAENADENIDGLLAQAEAIFNNADEVLAKYATVEAVA